MENKALEVTGKSEIKILVVDDREDNLLSIESILEKDNYQIVKANSGKAALKILLHQYDFSLILMDVQMPEMNGLETATIIYEREKLKSIPIIFITAYSNDEEYLFKGYRMGGVDYIYKPINPALLRVKVSVFVELYRKNHQLINHEQKLLAANKSLQKEIQLHKMSEEKVRLLNKQLLDNNAHLKSVNEELDRFAYVASHDLQEPLRKILMFSDKILHVKEEPTTVEKYLNKISVSAKRMQLLITDLMQFSQNAVINTDFIEVDLGHIIETVLTELEIEIQETSAEIRTESLPKLYVIPTLMQQVFYNLISNAIKFSRPGTAPIISISGELIKTGTKIYRNEFRPDINYYKIAVTDNGIGFDEKYAEEIFMPFKRLHSYHEYEGTGVGLAICKKNIEKHQGFIKAESRFNQGSSFVLVLPEKIFA